MHWDCSSKAPTIDYALFDIFEFAYLDDIFGPVTESGAFGFERGLSEPSEVDGDEMSFEELDSLDCLEPWFRAGSIAMDKEDWRLLAEELSIALNTEYLLVVG